MINFTFSRVQNIADALKPHSGDASAFIAGGTTLVDLMKLNVEKPRHLIDINALPLSAIERLPNGGVRIGAMARNSDVAHHQLIASQYPVLSEALLSGASAQLRNMATTGGNILQRTRCPYFRDPLWACNKREPGSGCSALDGHHRSHAIFGVSEQCIATNPSDMCVALIALDASVEVVGASGKRTLPFRGFHLQPGDTPNKETALAPGDLITAVELPAPMAGARGGYRKLRDRASYEFALVSVAAEIAMDGGKIREAKLAFGGVGTVPWRATAVEQLLSGKKADASLLSAAAAKAIEGAAPRRDNAFKVPLLRAAVTRILTELTGAHA